MTQVFASALSCGYSQVKEIEYWQDRKSSILETAGLFSYSLYLIHKLVITAFDELPVNVDPIGVWAAQLLAIFLAAFVFYILVERPAHRLARRLGAR